MPDNTVIECQNFAASAHRDPPNHFLALADDAMLSPDCLENALKCLHKTYPNSDGIVGLKVINVPTTTETSFLLIGRRYLKRFLFSKPFYPQYRHFGADTELGETARRFGKFQLCETARVRHLHPASGERKPDATHIWARRDDCVRTDMSLLNLRLKNFDVYGNLE